MEKFYIGECEHLENCCITDDECLKRYIHIDNPRTNKIECLIFCNDYLKLKAQQKTENNFVFKKDVVKLIENEILNHICIEKKYRQSSNSLSNYYFYKTVCQRPYLAVQLSFKEIINFYYENPTKESLDFIRENIHNFLDHLYYKKYTTKYKDLIRLSNKLKTYSGIDNNEKELILIELINETFKTTIKNN